MAGFFDANYNITKLSKNAKGEITYLELNGQSVSLTAALLCFKYSSTYLYVKNIPTEDEEDVTAYVGAPLAKVEADYNTELKTDDWGYNNKHYDQYGVQRASAPKGSSGGSVNIGSYVLASDDKFYKEVSDKWYQVLEFGKTEASTVLSETEVTDEELLTELEAATAKTVTYFLFIWNAGFTYGGAHYERYSTSDITIE